MLKKLLSHTVLYALGPQVSKILGFLILPFISPYLTEVDFGVWGTITAFTILFYSARDLGLTVPMLNAFYRHTSNWKWVWRQIIWYLLLWGVFLAVIQAIVLWVIFPQEGVTDRNTVITLFTIQMVLLDVPVLVASRYFQLKEKPQVIAIISAIAGGVSVAAHYLMVVEYAYGYMGWFFSGFLSTLIMAGAYSYFLTKHGIVPLLVFRYRLAKSRFRVGLPIVPHNYSAYLLNASDRSVMTFLRVPTSSIGVYNGAYVLGSYVNLIGNAMGLAIGPTYLRLYSKPDSEGTVLELTRLLQSLFIVGSFIVALWAKEFFQLFLVSEGLETAYVLAVVIVMSYSYRPLYWAVVNRIQYDEQTGILWKISFSAGLINIILNLIFIPQYGYAAAAYTTFASLLYMGFIGHILVPKTAGIHRLELFVWFMVINGFTWLAFALKDTLPVIKIIVTIATLCALTLISIRRIKILNSALTQ